MKRTLKKILLISLLFSAAVPSAAQANFFSRTTWRNRIVFSAVVATVFAWKLLSKTVKAIKLDSNLRAAIQSNNIARVKQILEKKPFLGNQFFTGRTPLQLAIICNNSEIVKLLLENGAKVDLQENSNARTPLMNAAAKAQNPIIINLLLDAGADPLLKTKDGTTALNLGRNNPTIGKFMQKKICPKLMEVFSEEEKLQDLDKENVSNIITKLTY